MVSLSTTRRGVLGLSTAAMIGATLRATDAAPEGELRVGVHVSLAPTWFDPAETPGIITPFMLLYAMHDAVIKAMPGDPMAPCLAESCTMSPEGLSYALSLRKGVKFHNGEELTAEDVKFSLERYRGAASKSLRDRVANVDIHDPHRLTIRLKEPWPDFLTFYAGASGAGWIVPKKYVEQVGDEGFKKAPIGAGPYRFVSFTPGVELVCEAFDGYWRKKPAIKRLVFKVIPDESTRLAALQRNEIDIAYSIRGELADELLRTPGLAIKPALGSAPYWLYFPEQWDPQSPWHDRRVRQAASFALDRKTMNEALTLGHSRLTGSIFPENFEFYWALPPPAYDPARARKLLAEAGHARGFDAGDYYCDTSYANIGEVALNNLREVGIRVKLRPLERAAFFKAYSEKKLKNIVQGASGAFGNCATRAEAFVAKGGTYVYGSYPDIDELFAEQAVEMDRAKRAATLQRLQQLVHDKAIYAPIWQLAFISGVGPRVDQSGFGLIKGFVYTAPYEDLTLKGKA
ncbi:peptide/nickel transport system substrate-binding protein [Rhodospirillales bacterium URHD0017]|nr:peptide/nickel transport system substrate-binding protein [Rhodospirillales bacterium URHD0017]